MDLHLDVKRDVVGSCASASVRRRGLLCFDAARSTLQFLLCVDDLGFKLDDALEKLLVRQSARNVLELVQPQVQELGAVANVPLDQAFFVQSGRFATLTALTIRPERAIRGVRESVALPLTPT